MALTRHASSRSAQRGIPLEIVATIHLYGMERVAPGGAHRLFLDRDSITLAEDVPRRRSELERYRNAYIVVGDDSRIITVARRTRRFFN